jgi:hypothetical protein
VRSSDEWREKCGERCKRYGGDGDTGTTDEERGEAHGNDTG